MPVPSLTEPTDVSTFQVPEIPSEDDVDDDGAGRGGGIGARARGVAEAATVGSADAAATGGSDARETGAGPAGRKNRYQRPAAAAMTSARKITPTTIAGPRDRVGWLADIGDLPGVAASVSHATRRP